MPRKGHFRYHEVPSRVLNNSPKSPKLSIFIITRAPFGNRFFSWPLQKKTMSRAVLLFLLSGILTCVEVRSQSSAPQDLPVYSYHPPSEDKESWQRLNLWLSSTYLYIAKEALTDQDSCLLLASHSLGLSRFSILAEGFGDSKLLAQSKWIDQGDPAAGIRQLSAATGKNHLQLLLF